MNRETSLFVPSDDPLRVTLLLLPESSMMSLASTLDPMRAANRVARRPLFSWRIVTPDGAPAPLTRGVPVPADGRFGRELEGDALIVVAGFTQECHRTEKHTPRLQ